MEDSCFHSQLTLAYQKRTNDRNIFAPEDELFNEVLSIISIAYMCFQIITLVLGINSNQVINNEIAIHRM